MMIGKLSCKQRLGEPIQQSRDALQPLREAVADCLDMLVEQDRFIINCMNSEMITYDELGKRLGVSLPHSWRLHQAANKNLEQIFLMDTRIRKYLRLADND